MRTERRDGPGLRSVLPLALGLLVATNALASPSASTEAALSLLSGRDAAFDGARVRERRTAVALTFAERVAAKRSFGVGIRYDYTRFVYQGLATRNRDLHRLAVPLAWGAVDDGWNAELTPTVATSSNVFKDLPGRGGRRDVDLHGRVGYRVVRTAGSGWRLGIRRDATLGEPRLHPEAALIWVGPAWDLELGFPTTRAAWRPAADLTLGAAVFPDGNRWHVVSDERGGASFDYRVRRWRAALTAGWEPSRRLRIEVQAGLAFHQRHRFEDDTGMRIDRRAASAPYGAVVAALRL